MIDILQNWDHERCPGLNVFGVQCKKLRTVTLAGERLKFCFAHGKKHLPARVRPSKEQLARMSTVLRAEYD